MAVSVVELAVGIAPGRLGLPGDFVETEIEVVCMIVA